MGSNTKMKSFVAVLAFVASVSAKPAAQVYAASPYAYPQAYGYTAAAPVAYHGVAPLAAATYAAAPVAAPYAAAPVAAHYGYAAAPAVYGGVYAGVYDPSVAYANLCPAAEAYIHEDIEAEAYVDAQIAAEPYVHEEIAAEPYVDAQIAAEPYVHEEIAAEAYVDE